LGWLVWDWLAGLAAVASSWVVTLDMHGSSGCLQLDLSGSGAGRPALTWLHLGDLIRRLPVPAQQRFVAHHSVAPK